MSFIQGPEYLILTVITEGVCRPSIEIGYGGSDRSRRGEKVSVIANNAVDL